jgi:hypothetical protein
MAWHFSLAIVRTFTLKKWRSKLNVLLWVYKIENEGVVVSDLYYGMVMVGWALVMLLKALV